MKKSEDELEKAKNLNKVLRKILGVISENDDVESQVLLLSGDLMDLVNELNEATLEDKIENKHIQLLIELLNILIGHLKDFKAKYVKTK